MDKIIKAVAPYLFIASCFFALGWSLGADKQPKILKEIQYKWLEDAAIPDVVIDLESPDVIYQVLGDTNSIIDTVKVLVPVKTNYTNFRIAPEDPIRYNSKKIWYRSSDPKTGNESVAEYTLPKKRHHLRLDAELSIYRLNHSFGFSPEIQLNYRNYSLFSAARFDEDVWLYYGAKVKIPILN